MLFIASVGPFETWKVCHPRSGSPLALIWRPPGAFSCHPPGWNLEDETRPPGFFPIGTDGGRCRVRGAAPSMTGYASPVGPPSGGSPYLRLPFGLDACPARLAHEQPSRHITVLLRQGSCATVAAAAPAERARADTGSRALGPGCEVSRTELFGSPNRSRRGADRRLPLRASVPALRAAPVIRLPNDREQSSSSHD